MLFLEAMLLLMMSRRAVIYETAGTVSIKGEVEVILLIAVEVQLRIVVDTIADVTIISDEEMTRKGVETKATETGTRSTDIIDRDQSRLRSEEGIEKVGTGKIIKIITAGITTDITEIKLIKGKLLLFLPFLLT